MLCSVKSAAKKRYERRVLSAMGAYIAVLLLTGRVVHHDRPHGWVLYFFAGLPAIPVIITIVAMGRYLHEETDEYQRTLLVRSILIATGALLGTLVMSDFLRAYAGVAALDPFICFLIFYVAFAIVQGIQTLQNRVSGDD